MMKKIAAVNDLSGFGKCSLTAAIPVISALGVQCCPLVTGIFSNQTGYDSFYCKDFTDDMKPCIEQWKKLDAKFDGILTGFISNSRQGEIIGELIDTFKTDETVVAVDPVMADDGEIYKCYDDESIKSIIALCEKADLITPNLTELCILCGEDYQRISALEEEMLFEKIKAMSEKVSGINGKIVVTSGIHIPNKKIANTVLENGVFDIIISDSAGESFSGTGDILSSFITAQFVKGVNVKTAVKQAADFIYKAISVTIEETGGNYNCADGTHFEKLLYTLGEI
ncbi:MAG: pyridoxamine kinase [Faecalibacterium sp.]|nr:pyridoxamine kinase [Ruminococcus sp.]MCM1391344.1 pyridoxamine kinase [Ruminococcus sp.]MCM1484903.1 pyridoxamine kinase [Faecalibacterium sp.]